MPSLPGKKWFKLSSQKKIEFLSIIFSLKTHFYLFRTQHTSVKFDPFMHLSLPLPEPKQEGLEILLVDRNWLRMRVCLKNMKLGSTYRAVKDQIGYLTGM